MGAVAFVVAEKGGQPTFLFQSMHQASQTLGVGFVRDDLRRFRSDDDRWSGWLATDTDVKDLLYGLAEVSAA